ncbi:MAG: hypothetical protein F4166_04570 [Gammaproteobacteria bacterium]|nr:hypothetical protein [Gammaproteobacteria bacterium]MYF53081.1 hypothetical protein [Gammaproteobacteria bacterium]
MRIAHSTELSGKNGGRKSLDHANRGNSVADRNIISALKYLITAINSRNWDTETLSETDEIEEKAFIAIQSFQVQEPIGLSHYDFLQWVNCRDIHLGL